MTLTRFSLILLLMATLSACGFQLRGSERVLNKSFPTMALALSSRDISFENALKVMLTEADIQLSDGSAHRLEILRTEDLKRTASYSSRAKSAEYELIKSVTFRFTRDDQELIAPMHFEARRSYLYRETAAVGKAEEEILLRQEMDRDLALRIMLAIQRAADVAQEQSASAGAP